MKIVGILLIAGLTNVFAREWIDPHDMNTNAKHKYIQPKLKKSASTYSINDKDLEPLPDISYTYLKRVIAVLVNSAYVDKRDPEIYYGHIRFYVEPKQFDFLVHFGQQDLTLDNLRKLDTVFSKSFKRTYIDEYLDTIESFQLKLYSLVVNIQNLWLVGAVCLLCVLYQLVKNDFALSYIVKYLIIILFFVDFGFRYHHLLEEAEEFNLSVIYSKECDVNKMSWGEWTKFVFSSRNCEKKTVTPLDAFLYQIKNIIIIPMHAFGTGMGGFGKNMFTSLPWGLSLVMWPVLVVFTLILALFLMTICTGQSIEFNIFHLFKLRFGGGSHRTDNTLTGPTVERLIDKILHRPMVQNVNDSLVAGDNNSAQKKFDNSSPPQISGGENSPVPVNDILNKRCKTRSKTQEANDDASENKVTSEKATNPSFIPHREAPARGSEFSALIGDEKGEEEPFCLEQKSENKGSGSPPKEKPSDERYSYDTSKSPATDLSSRTDNPLVSEN